MAKMKLTFEQTDCIFSELEEGEDWEGFKVVERCEWDDQGKYQYKSIVFEYEDKLWEITITRHGSYFSDYYFNYREFEEGLEAIEVEKKEVITHGWVAVKDKE